MHLLIIYTVWLFQLPICMKGNIISLCWTDSERIPVLQWKHHIKLLISALTHWKSLKPEMDSFSTSPFTSRQIRGLGCGQERGDQYFYSYLRLPAASNHFRIFILLAAVWSASGLENPIWMLLQKEKVSGKGL